MMDILSLGLTVVFFALSVGLIALCDRPDTERAELRHAKAVLAK